MDPARRHEHLQRARLYLVCGRRPASFLRAALAGGVDIVQLRDKDADDDELLAAAETFRACCNEAGALFVVNDRPDLAVAAGADGVHVGQDDMPVAAARETAGPGLLVGRSTHAPAQLAASGDADYVAVGPVYETPTKPGRPATGLAYLEHAARHATLPWFAIGGIDERTIGDVVAAGAQRVVVARALTDSPDPEAAAARLRAATGVRVGTP